VLPALVLVTLVLAVPALGRLVARTRVRGTTCCSAHPWPPDDLTGAGT
jgi:hypothetical protein